MCELRARQKSATWLGQAPVRPSTHRHARLGFRFGLALALALGFWLLRLLQAHLWSLAKKTGCEFELGPLSLSPSLPPSVPLFPFLLSLSLPLSLSPSLSRSKSRTAKSHVPASTSKLPQSLARNKACAHTVGCAGVNWKAVVRKKRRRKKRKNGSV